MIPLSAWFEHLLGDSQIKVVTVIGSGGKTSLIWHLAAVLAGSRAILVTPTTKMFVPDLKCYDRYYNGIPPAPERGITLAGNYNEASGKLEALPSGELEAIAPDYNVVLIEGDGSKGLPLKAWTEDEPVVPHFTDLTIGVLSLRPLGKPVSEQIVHRLPLFTALTGAAAGEALETEHLLRLIASNGTFSKPGLFVKASGRKLLFFNQVEDDISLRQARLVTEQLPAEFRRGLFGVIAGSVRLNRLEEL